LNYPFAINSLILKNEAGGYLYLIWSGVRVWARGKT
jgi:hypothetical protein